MKGEMSVNMLIYPEMKAFQIIFYYGPDEKNSVFTNPS